MQSLIYDGTFEGWLCAIFNVYEYKFTDVEICTQQNFKGNVFQNPQVVFTDRVHSDRLWAGLKKKLSASGLKNIYKAFLSEIEGIENVLLQYVQYVFDNSVSIENDFSHPAVVTIENTVKKVGREKHRMEAFVRFQKTKDNLYYAVIDPDFNVLPLIQDHFVKRYADQLWMIYDSKRKYGIYFDKKVCTEITMTFDPSANNGLEVSRHFTDDEEIYQGLWQCYFKNVNIAARKNTKLHLQHVPKRYWKYLTEKF